MTKREGENGMCNFSNLRKRMIVFGLLLLLISTTSFAADQLWEQNFPSDIKWQKLTATGHLVVCTDDALRGLNPETGEFIWTIEELKDFKEEDFELIDLTPYALASKGKGLFKGGGNNLSLIDITNGTTLWTTDELGISSSAGNWLLPQVNALLIVGSLGKNINEKTLICLDIATGKEIWHQKDFFKKYKAQFWPAGKTKISLEGNQFPAFDSEESIIVNWSPEGLRKINIKTGETIWQTKLKVKITPAIFAGFAPMLTNDDQSILYIPTDKSITAVKTSDGSLLWKVGPKLKGMAHDIRLTPHGLLVMGGPNLEGKDGDPYITLVDPATGALKWNKEFTKLKASTNYVYEGDHIVVYSDKKLYKIAFADGSFTELAKDLKFEGGEDPSTLELRENGYFMKSSQNLMLVDKNGTEIYHAFFKAPGTSMFAKIASTALVTAVNTMSIESARERAQSQAMVYGRGEASYSLVSNPYMSKRYKATKSGANYQFILTNVKDEPNDGPGLVKASKNTGQAEKQIYLGTKEPEYELDEIESRLFFKATDKKIVCYSF